MRANPVTLIFAAILLLAASLAAAESAAEVIEPDPPAPAKAADPKPVAPAPDPAPAPAPVPAPPPEKQADPIMPPPLAPLAQLDPLGVQPDVPRSSQPVSRMPIVVNEPDFKATAIFPETPKPKYDQDTRPPKDVIKPKRREFTVSDEEGVPITATPDEGVAKQAQPEVEEISPLLARAIAREKELAAKKPKEIPALYQAVVDAEPENAEAHYRLGLALNKSGDLRAALVELPQAIKLKPNVGKYLCDFGLVALRAGWIERAVDACRAAAQGTPANARFQSALGDALTSAGDLNEAAEVYMRASNLDPKNPEYYHNLGKCLLYGRAYKRAGSVIDEAIRLRPDHAAYYCTRGLAYQSDKAVKEAIGCYMMALKLDKNYAYAHYLLAGCFSDAEDPTYTNRFQAQEHAEQAVKLTEKKNPQYLMGLARVMRLTRNYDQAVELSKLALAIEPREEWRQEMQEFERLRTEGGKQ